MSRSDEQLEARDLRKGRKTGDGLPADPRLGGGRTVDWADADPVYVMALVCVVSVHGGAVRLGYTRNGDAYSIGLYRGENSRTYYANSLAELQTLVEYLHEQFKK